MCGQLAAGQHWVFKFNAEMVSPHIHTYIKQYVRVCICRSMAKCGSKFSFFVNIFIVFVVVFIVFAVSVFSGGKS